VAGIPKSTRATPAGRSDRTGARRAGHRADFERERDRTDQMVAAQDRLITELKNLRALLQTAPGARKSRPPQRSVNPIRVLLATGLALSIRSRRDVIIPITGHLAGPPFPKA
jgi:hypothetical protein